MQRDLRCPLFRFTQMYSLTNFALSGDNESQIISITNIYGRKLNIDFLGKQVWTSEYGKNFPYRLQ